ncbi:MAG: hypothetical protein AB1626_04865 [Candidatus Micrarchaeota archaeon]
MRFTAPLCILLLVLSQFAAAPGQARIVAGNPVELELYSIISDPDRAVVQENEVVTFTLYVKNYGNTSAKNVPLWLNVTHANSTTEFNCGLVDADAQAIVNRDCGTVTATANGSYILASGYAQNISTEVTLEDNYKNLTLTVHATSDIPPAVPETHWMLALFSAAAAALLLSRKKEV